MCLESASAMLALASTSASAVGEAGVAAACLLRRSVARLRIRLRGAHVRTHGLKVVRGCERVWVRSSKHALARCKHRLK